MRNFTPAWFKKGFFNESLFCDDFLSSHQLLYSNGAFFTPDGRIMRCDSDSGKKLIKSMVLRTADRQGMC